MRSLLRLGAKAAPAPVAEPKAPATLAPIPMAPARRDPDRFELKYWIPESTAEKIAHWVRPHVELDRHGPADAGPAQCNTSLYLESPDLVCFRRHVESAPERFKLRVRAYGDPVAGLAFFETKRKVRMVTVKTRAAVPLALAPSLLDGSYDRLPDLAPAPARHLAEFLYLQAIIRAEPLVLVRCWREAYASVDPLEDVRVTLDRGICFQPAQGASFALDERAWVPLDERERNHRGAREPLVMLELKFPRRAPWWMRQLVNQLEAPRVSYSKYISAVRLLRDTEMNEHWDLDSVARGGF